MKKHFRKTTFILAIVTMIASFAAMSVSAEPVPGTYYDTTAQYTSITDTYGYSGVSYIGGYYGNGHIDNYAQIRADCRGGSVDEFLTSAYIYVNGYFDTGRRRWTADADSDEMGRYVETIIRINLNNNIDDVSGYVEERSENKTNPNDYWEYSYLMYWRSASRGWE